MDMESVETGFEAVELSENLHFLTLFLNYFDYSMNSGVMILLHNADRVMFGTCCSLHSYSFSYNVTSNYI